MKRLFCFFLIFMLMPAALAAVPSQVSIYRDGVLSRQEDLQEKITQLEQTADAIKIAVEKLTDDGTDKIKTAMGYTFDDRGLHIHKEGGEIQNRLDESGMQVLRNTGSSQETVMLRADAQGVLATDVQVRNYLVIGSFSRVEDYGQNRTACFYLGGA